VGTEVGSPVTAFASGAAYFGPVVVPVPSGEEALRLFDALRLLASVPAFSELKTAGLRSSKPCGRGNRHRRQGGGARSSTGMTDRAGTLRGLRQAEPTACH
jgi:hypothetical protein